MHARIDGVVFLDELSLLVGFYVVFVTVVVLAKFLDPSGIDVLVAALVLLALALLGIAVLRLPEILAVALHNLLVLITGVSLTGSLDKGGIDNLPLVEGQIQGAKIEAVLSNKRSKVPV